MPHAALLAAYYRSRGIDVFAVLDELRAAESLSPAQYAQLEQQKLERALARARREVPYYRSSGYSRLEDYPVLSKHEIWQHLAELQADGAPPIDSGHPDAVMVTSSGSSGRRLKVYCDRPEQAWNLALSWLGELWPGRPGEAEIPLLAGTALLWGASDLRSGAMHEWRKQLRSSLRREFMYGCYRLDDAQMRRVHADLLLRRPQRIVGYVSNLRYFSQLARRAGLASIRCRKLVATAEQLDAHSRDEITAFFDAPLLQRYGCREAGGIAMQCEHGAWHLFSLHLYPEVLRDDGSIARSGSGRLLLTKLNARRMPLIRYDIEDRVTLAGPDAPPCPCGRPWPRMLALEGREIDYVFLPDGSRLHGLGIAEAFRGSSAEQFCVVQGPNGGIKALIVPGPGFDATAAELIASRISATVAGRLSVSFELVAAIPDEIADPGRSGKQRQVLSHWRPQQSADSHNNQPQTSGA